MLSLIPIFAYILIVKLLDNFTVVRWQRLLLCCTMGMGVCGLLAVCGDIEAWQLLIQRVGGPETAYPVIEEMTKGAFVLCLIMRRKIVFFAEALCYGAAIGAGFALLENILYNLSYPDMTLFAEAIRGFGTALLHMGCTAMTAVTMLSVNRFAAFIPAIVIHYIYNMFLLPPFVQLVVVMVFFLGIFAAVSAYDEKRIYRWMDFSITDDIQLLAAIREGRLTDTPAGQYLLKVRNQFSPEVFFDVLCYMQLYLELVVQGKSRMLLEQEGLAAPLTPQESELLASKQTELNTLGQSIGYMGKHVLRPILRFNIEDTKIVTK